MLNDDFGQTQQAGDTQAYISILHVMSLYHTALDEGEFDTFSAVFTSDGVFEIKGKARLDGLDAIQKGLAERRHQRLENADGAVFQRHHLTTRRIDISTDGTATATSYFFVTTEIGQDHFGRYFDRYRKYGEKWLLEYRRSELDWIADSSRFKPYSALSKS